MGTIINISNSFYSQVHQRCEPCLSDTFTDAQGSHSAQLQQVTCLMGVRRLISGQKTEPHLLFHKQPLLFRWATEAAAIWDFRKQPSWQWPETRSIIFAAGQCGMDQIDEPPSGSSEYGGQYRNDCKFLLHHRICDSLFFILNAQNRCQKHS